jgi:hypothetical protein
VVFSALQALSCNYYMVYLALAMVLFGASLGVYGRDLLDRRKIAFFALGVAVVITLCLPFLVPYTRNRDRGFYRRYEDVVYYSASFGLPVSLAVQPSPIRKLGSLPEPIGEGASSRIRRLRPRPGRRRRRVRPQSFVLALLHGSYGDRGSSVARTGAAMGRRHPPASVPFLVPSRPRLRQHSVPARISVLALFGIAVLAGLGTAALVEKWKKPLAVGLLGLLLFEYRTYSLESAFPEAPAASAAHLWLAQEKAQGAVLVLPIHEGREILRESLAMYHSTAHFQPLVNGYSGWWPNDYWELVGRLRRFPTARSLRFLLERAPVRYVVVHYDRIPEPRRRELERGMERYRESMPMVFRREDEAVYEIRKPADPS